MRGHYPHLALPLRHERYQHDFTEKLDSQYTHTLTEGEEGECYRDQVCMRKFDTHRLSCPLDKEVQLSSFLLQLYPVTDSLPWASTPTHTQTHIHSHTHTALQQRNISFHCGPLFLTLFSAFHFSVTSWPTFSPFNTSCSHVTAQQKCIHKCGITQWTDVKFNTNNHTTKLKSWDC